MSAYSNLLGLYPTSKKNLDLILSELEQENKWPQAVPWQPIPVHTTPRSIDYVRIYVLQESDSICSFIFVIIIYFD